MFDVGLLAIDGTTLPGSEWTAWFGGDHLRDNEEDDDEEVETDTEDIAAFCDDGRRRRSRGRECGRRPAVRRGDVVLGEAGDGDIAPPVTTDSDVEAFGDEMLREWILLNLPHGALKDFGVDDKNNDNSRP